MSMLDSHALALRQPEIASLEQACTRVQRPVDQGGAVWRQWGRGTPVVLIHGGQGCWMHWAMNIAALARHHSVWAVDLPGMGESPMPPGPFTEQSLADSVAADLQELLGAQHGHLVGFSFGALVAGHVAARHPGFVLSLSLVGAPAMGLPATPLDLLSWRGLAPGDERDAAHLHNLQALMIDAPSFQGDLALALAIQRYSNEAARLKSRPLALGDSLLRVLREVRCPKRGLWGEHDFLLRDQLDLLQAAAARVNLPAAIVPGSGHWLPFERPAWFNADLRAFVGP